MMHIDVRDVTVVIREAGERTAAICRGLIDAQVPADQVRSVNGVPFATTLAASYRAGIESGRKWTLCVDADVLIARDALSKLLAAGERAPANVFGVQAMIYDKLLDCVRPAGNRLYRTALLEKALTRISSDPLVIRPETHVVEQMGRLGHPWLMSGILLGLHDFEQYYRDVFRKASLHAHKHLDFGPALIAQWRRKAVDDPDYEVALWGFTAGIADRGAGRADVTAAPYGLYDAMAPEGWSEKADLVALDYAVDARLQELVTGLLVRDGAVLLPHFFELTRSEEGANGRATGALSLSFRRAYERAGAAMLLPWIAGTALSKLGRRIVAVAERKGRGQVPQ